MRDENGRMVSPDNFISAAERYGITPNIDRWVIENALRWLVSEADERERLALCSINLSGASLADNEFLPFVIRQFQRSGIDASKICFEITETAAIADIAGLQRWARRLKELGCGFALDDFGTGFSSFAYLQALPVDLVKIDGSFVRDLDTNPTNRALVGAMVAVAHALGKTVVAEMIERGPVADILRELGAEYGQGWFWGKPGLADQS